MGFSRIKLLELDRRLILVYLFFLVWSLIAWSNLYKFFLREIPFYLSINKLEDKHFLFESDNYYNLILFCLKHIPENKDITFINVLSDKLLPHSKFWIRAEYYIEKAPFYLYPRKIYRQINTPSSGVEYEVHFNPKEDRFILLENKRVIYASN